MYVPIHSIQKRRFSPRSIAGGWSWLRGDPATITSTPTKISAWNDSFGNGNHAVQGTDSLRPPYTAANANFNGKASGRWNAAQCLDFVNAIGNWDNVTVCLVTRPVAVTGTQLLMESDTTAGARDFQVYQSGAADGPNLYVNGAAGLDAVKIATSDTTLTKYHRTYGMPWATLSSTLPTISTNGVAASLTTVSNTGTNTTIANTILHLGARAGGTVGYNGDIADVIIYVGNGSVGILTAQEIANLYAWTSAEYGV